MVFPTAERVTWRIAAALAKLPLSTTVTNTGIAFRSSRTDWFLTGYNREK